MPDQHNEGGQAVGFADEWDDELVDRLAAALLDHWRAPEDDGGAYDAAVAEVRVVLSALALRQVGWLGTEWEGASYADAATFDPKDANLEPDDRWYTDDDEVVIYDCGDWSLRHEDGSDDLVRPIPIYARLSDYTLPAARSDS